MLERGDGEPVATGQWAIAGPWSQEDADRLARHLVHQEGFRGLSLHYIQPTPSQPAPEQDDLPGSLALAQAISKGEWPHTMDAQAWVTAWMLQLKETPEIYKDEGAMIGWFANAIMAGYDTAQMRASQQAPAGGVRGAAVLALAQLDKCRVYLPSSGSFGEDGINDYEHAQQALRKALTDADAGRDAVIDAAQRLIEWDRKWPKGTILPYAGFGKCEDELAEIVEQFKSALKGRGGL